MTSHKIHNDTGRIYHVPNSDEYMSQRLSCGIWGKTYLKRIKSLCPKIRHALDIGGNLGQSTVELAQISERVTMFEPVPSTYELAVKTIKDNRKKFYPTADIATYNFAIGQSCGEVDMTQRCNNVGMNHIVMNANRSKNTVRVPIRTVDSFKFTDVDFIKIDVEGYELFVLNGAKATIDSYRPLIQTELVPSHLASTNTTTQNIQDVFNAINYTRVLKNGNIVKGKKFKALRNPGDSFWVPSEKL